MFHAKWNREVSAVMARGVDRVQAIRTVDQSHPGLRQKMIAEANEQRGRPVPTGSAASETKAFSKSPNSLSKRDIWDAVIADYISQGMSRTAAFSEACKNYANLRESMIEEANETRGTYARNNRNY